MRADGKSWVRTILLFQVPIRQKFWIFGVSTGIWTLVIGALAAVGARDSMFRDLIIISCSLMLFALIGFSVLITRSLTQPLAKLRGRIVDLANGEALPEENDIQEIRDELDDVHAQSFRLLESLQEIRTFKRVIEGDDRAEDVLRRLGVEFQRLGLPDHAVREMTPGGKGMRTVLSGGGREDDSCNVDIFLDADLCRAKKTGGIVSTQDYPNVCRQFARQGSGHVCIPMMVGGATEAVVHFRFDGAAGAGLKANRVAVDRARRFIDEARPVLEVRRLMDALRESSVRDALTGLHNRRFLDEAEVRMVAGAHRRKTALGFLMCDLDFFKEVNDIHGHDVGDLVLKETARRISASVRANDVVIRYGGEEFLVILEDAATNSPVDVAERIRASVGAATVPTPTGALSKTISVGVAEFPLDGASFWQVVKFADVALYKAKESGRNRVARFTADLWKNDEY